MKVNGIPHRPERLVGFLFATHLRLRGRRAPAGPPPDFPPEISPDSWYYFSGAGIHNRPSGGRLTHRKLMLLTIRTTARPATDLGYLLHKNPARLQSFELSFGQAHVFYPEATERRARRRCSSTSTRSAWSAAAGPPGKAVSWSSTSTIGRTSLRRS